MPSDFGGFLPHEFTPEIAAPREVPIWEDRGYLDVLPESDREVLVFGDPEKCKEFNHHQGDNPLGFQGTCGLVSCCDILEQFGIPATEASVVIYAAEHGLCTTEGKPENCGGTSPFQQARLLTEAGVPAHVEWGQSMEDLADAVQLGRGVIIGVNAGVLWNDARAVGDDPEAPNHAIVVTGVARDPISGEVVGFYINDSGRGYPSDSGRFLRADLVRESWVATGGVCVLTDLIR